MDYIQLPENAIRQAIDSTTIFVEYCRVQERAKAYVGGMYWKRQGEHQYLVKTTPDNRQSRIGPRAQGTEKIYEAFTSSKREVEARLESLKAALTEAERQNKAVRAGRVPTLVVAVLQAIESAGLGEHFTVVGTHALYAYEAAAGVRIEQGALATQDVDLLWDARKHVRFLSDLEKLGESMLAVLRRADPSFIRKEGATSTAINNRGFEVDFLRRQAEGNDPHPFQFSGDKEDLWAIQALRANVLTEAPRFEQVVISTTGRMALMRTISPQTFVAFKRWLGTDAPNRDAAKRRRDLRQAQIVEALLLRHSVIPDTGAMTMQPNPSPIDASESASIPDSRPA